MIITSDKVGMNSSRDYSWNMTQSTATSTQVAGGLFSDITRQTYEKSYSSKEQYDSYTHTGAQSDSTEDKDIYNPENYLQGAFIYTDFRASNFQANVVTPDSSVSSTFADFKQESFYSLLDLIRNFRLRSLFDSESSAVSDSTLVMSNSNNAVLWSIHSTYSSIYTEKEVTSFSTTGCVTTADGRSIDFSMNLEMSREYMEQTNLTFLNQYQSVLTDPLVINLTDAPASISDQTFLFDIDGDGKKEEHASLNSSSGFLALDKNNDGIINDGSELFGTKSGNGFADLAAYDADGNGWIDEADDIYKDLKVWTKDENGKDTLLSLKDADVGAIYLGSSKTDFSMTDDNNTDRARVRQTGLYLHESGTAGSVQQIDL